MAITTITPKELISHNTFNAAKFFLAYKECSKEVQSIVDEMIEIVADEEIDWDDRTHAVDVIIEALFPSLTADCVMTDEMALQSEAAAQEAEFLNHQEATFASNLQRFMDSRGLTQKELAKRTGVSQPAISNILNRDCRPQRRTIARFAEVLNVKPEDLWPSE